MLDFFWRRCPIDQDERDWLEFRLGWLVDQFGAGHLTRCPIILPTREFFDEPYDGTMQAAQDVFGRICRYMGLNQEYVDFRIFDAKREGGGEVDLFTGGYTYQSNFTPGLYHDGWQQGISIDRAHCQDHFGLIAVIAHELSHVKLKRESAIDDGVEDYEKLTDLTAVFFGFGVFLARTVERDFRLDEEGEEVPTSKLGYLPQATVCHALATIAWVRDDLKPQWGRHLGWYAKQKFKRSVRYLRRTGDTIFRAREAPRARSAPTERDPQELKRMLDEAVAREDYESAAEIKKRLDEMTK